MEGAEACTPLCDMYAMTGMSSIRAMICTVSHFLHPSIPYTSHFLEQLMQEPASPIDHSKSIGQVPVEIQYRSAVVRRGNRRR